MADTHYTYDATQLNSTVAGYFAGATVGNRYQVRLMLQDTKLSKQLFQDEEIDWVLTQESNVYTAAAQLCDTLVAKAGGVKSKKVDDLSIAYDPHFYRTLSGQLRARGMGNQVPYAGGISVADKAAQTDDNASTSPSVFRRLDDNPGAQSPSVIPDNPLNTI